MDQEGQDHSTRGPNGLSGRGVHLRDPMPRPSDSARVDTLQDELMSRQSADGRPPPRRLRVKEWHWLAALLPIMLIAAVAWVVGRRVDAGTVLLGLVLVVVLVAAAAPVWGAGLMRGGEEREARREARVQAASRSRAKQRAGPLDR